MQIFTRSALTAENYRPLFSGHETFPLRYGWLKKAFDAVALRNGATDSRDVFLGEDAIARFGVGKNMVASIRHWATCCGVISFDEKAGTLSTTPMGDLIFSRNGCDPYLESPATLWLLHWWLCFIDETRPSKTTWAWTFNHYPSLDFNREDVGEGLLKLAEARGWTRVAPKTVQNDVDCLIRTYEARHSERDTVEDSLSSPLSELGLIRGTRGHFQLVRGHKRSLPNAVFAYALNQFWNRMGGKKTLSFEAISHQPGSPGRIFLLHESDLADRLLALEDTTRGAIRWSETAGIKQAMRTDPFTSSQSLKLLRQAYLAQREKEAA